MARRASRGLRKVIQGGGSQTWKPACPSNNSSPLSSRQIMGDPLGRYVAELGVLLMDPKRQVGRHAREGIYRLYELALQQRGIDIWEMAGLWIREPHLDWEMASYQNTMQMAKAQGTEVKIQRHLHRLRECGKQPMKLRWLLAGKDDVLIYDLEEEEEMEEEAEEAE
ncbi:hypothetical protein JRQ81_014222 [Phrynocephalus forsythii]|uniref:Uncharacterized protein n=1 Tax=Phrynocephalus forsythii TaxID=171643 RepID=A0A9Q1B2L8_9SAUR|nr:hypothetical protein JRQ81_014222 [Phrynocephalus forsythii]